MAYVPAGALDAATAQLKLPDSVTVRVEMFSCRKVQASQKKRDRHSAQLDTSAVGQQPDFSLMQPSPPQPRGGLSEADRLGSSPTSPGTTTATNSATPTSGGTVGQRSILDAGGALEFFRSTSFGDDESSSVVRTTLPMLVAAMNGLYEPDGFEFTGVLSEEQFEHIADPFQFDSDVAAAMQLTEPELVRFWHVISEAALAKSTGGGPPPPASSGGLTSPCAGPAVRVSEWATLFRLLRTPEDPLDQDDAVESAATFFLYCRKTRVVVAVVVRKARSGVRDDNASPLPADLGFDEG